MSAVPIYNGQHSASLSTCVVPIPDEHLLQPHPFTSEDEYWQLILARLETRHWYHQLRAARATLLTTGLGHEARDDLSALHEHQTALKTQDAHLLQGYRTRVAFTPPRYPAPRLLRLAARLHLTEVECDIVHYLVLMGCEGAFSGAMSDTYDVGNVADILGLDPHDFFAFLDPTKPILRYDSAGGKRHSRTHFFIRSGRYGDRGPLGTDHHTGRQGAGPRRLALRLRNRTGSALLAA